MPMTRFEPGPGDDSPSTITLRYLYLTQIRKHAPRVLEELSRRPWRYFSRACVDVYVQHHLCDPDHGNQAWLSEILADPDSDFWRNPRSAVYYKRIHPYAGRFYLSSRLFVRLLPQYSVGL